MQKLFRLFHLVTLLFIAGTGFAQTPTATVADGFNDGIRDQTIWYKTNWAENIFKESDGVLRMYSNPTNSVDEGHVGALMTRFVYLYNNADTLSLSCKARVPHMIESDPGGAISNSFEVGLGLLASLSQSELVELTVRDSQSNRQFAIYIMSEGLGYQDTLSYPAPTNTDRFFLRMSYSKKTDLLNFFWAPSATAEWQKIRPPLKLSDWVERDRPLRIRPYVTSYTENIQVLPEWGVYLDNFKAIYNDLPL
jgi:hypothetical protein